MACTPGSASRRGRAPLPLCVALSVVAALPVAAWSGEIERNLEALVGKVAAELMVREYGTIDNPLLTEWVDGVGQRVAAQCPRQEFPYRFRILDTPERNAFALPGAHIFVTRGLLAALQSDDELGAMLAHEVAHVGDRDFQRIVTRQLLFLGLGVVVERADHEELLTPLRVVQLVNSLRHSRRQEDQADQRGVAYALGARYDPVALTGFLQAALGKRSRPRPWYEAILDTHPDAYKRLSRCLERSRRLKSARPDDLAALADDLARRHRYAAALRNYELLRELEPNGTRALLGLGHVHLARGEPDLCVENCRAALALQPDQAEAATLLAEVRRAMGRKPGPRASRKPQTPSLGAAAAPSADLDRAAIARLRGLARQLEKDRRFNDALTWAQAYRPETGDWRWLYLLARTRVLLMAVDRLRWRTLEAADLAQTGADAWADLPVPPDSPHAKSAIMWYNGGAVAGVRGAKELGVAMELLPVALTTLALTGPRDPFGRMSSSRFALLEMDLLVAEQHVHRALDECRNAARDVAAAESWRLALTLDQLADRADEGEFAICEGLAAVRLGRSLEEIRASVAADGGLGTGCRRMANELAEQTGPPAEPDGATYEQVEAVRITLKLLLSECTAETIGPSSAAQRAA